MNRPRSAISSYRWRTLYAVIAAAAIAVCATGVSSADTAASGFGCQTDPAAGRPSPIICTPGGSGIAPQLAPKLPLVIALYGAGGSPQLMEGLTHLEAVAREHGFVLAYAGSSDSRHPWAPWSDVTYIGSLIDQLIATHNVDPNRVYVAGFSAGGGEAWRDACHLSTKVTAIAVDAENETVRPWGCTPARPVSQLLMVGTADGQRWTGIPGKLLTPQGTTQRWRQIDGCTAQQPDLTQHPVPAVTHESWTSCTDGSAVALYTFGGVTHNWPLGGPGTPPGYSASEAVWSFFAPLHGAPLSLPSRDARVSGIGVNRVKRHFVVVATVRAAEAVTGTAQVRGRRRLARRTLQLRPGAKLRVRLNLPAKVKAGKYLVSFTLKDSYGRTSTTSARVKVP
ncbi:MAG: polyhydroxybutyrate depolymerase [Solirubrobacteraceae bacterium]|nr:polyhydroxybutyrate depolymerase [Solirubrobacteraceae bacterium]